MTAPEIARRLSRAQREAVTRGRHEPTKAFTSNWGTAKCLERKGLTEYPGYVADLTPLGLAVRSIIEQEGGK
ncbi:hypothetical protein HMPREF9946_03122 [Acetobacteraceae bacterium AT-5844]|nr:hypothetical protein HMPREF9946_03122 [Acetobacteraceae bacterium AT-5844]